jgi:hypothetical protein
MGRVKIALLHATRGNPAAAMLTRQTWFDRADDTSLVEHIFGIQEDDAKSRERFAGACCDFATSPTPPEWASSSVANWNAAAQATDADLFICIADDLTPPPGWDSVLRNAIRDTSVPFAIFVADQLANDGLLRHPIMSRGLYERRGYVFDPDYYGVFCDNDLTTWCQVNQVPILRMRPELLKFHHAHDMTGNPVTAQQNRSEAYRYGEATYRRKWAAVIPRKVTETHSVWIGSTLSRMERLTLAMLVYHGHNPTLWVDRNQFDDFANVPDGVTVLFVPDNLLPPVPFRGLRHPTIPNGGHGSYAQWSDWFATYILSIKPGALWCQLDIAALEPIHVCENTFTTYSGGLSVCAFTLRRDLAWDSHVAMTDMVQSGMAGLDWHDTMRLVENIATKAGARVTTFPGYFDCGGRPSSPFNRPVAQADRPKLIHWSNATHGYSKNDPVAGSLYAELLEEFGI